jgi:hypothetical protein
LQYPVQTGQELADHQEGIMKQMVDEHDNRKGSPNHKRSLSPKNLADHDAAFAGFDM